MKKILIPVENQQRIEEPLKLAVDFHKIPNEVKYGAYIEKIYETANKNNFMDKVVKLYEKEGIETDSKVIEGDPSAEIIDEADNGNYDLVIMETHSMKDNKRFLLGSVTNKVVHHINVPILVVR